MRQVFEILQRHRFFIKFKKCAFGQHELEYLGHIVTPDRVKVDQNKIQMMIDWAWPNNLTELRGFLGLTYNYRKFVRDYDILVRPLINLLKKGHFGWSEEVEETSRNVKQALTTMPTLALPNFEEPFCRRDRCFRRWYRGRSHSTRAFHCIHESGTWGCQTSMVHLCQGNVRHCHGSQTLESVFNGSKVLCAHRSEKLETLIKSTYHNSWIVEVAF